MRGLLAARAFIPAISPDPGAVHFLTEAVAPGLTPTDVP
jgi:hypothetical protein